MKKIFLFAIFFIVSFHKMAFGGVFFEDGFEKGDLTHIDSTSGAKWTSSNRTKVTSEMSHSGLFALKFTFIGNPDVTVDATAEQRFYLGTPKKEIYIRFYIYYPSNYTIRTDTTPGTENTKLLYLWASDYTADMGKVGVEYETDMKFGFKAKGTGYPLVPSCSGATGYISELRKSTLSINDIKGRWVAVEIHHKVDSGDGDGVFQLWIDDTLQIDAKQLSWIGGPCSPGYLLNGYLMGWSNSGFTQDTFVYIDDVAFSDNYIGPKGINTNLPAINIIK